MFPRRELARRFTSAAVGWYRSRALRHQAWYANRGTVHRLVQQTLHAHQADSVDTLRAVEVARLDALQQAFWEPAMSGDLRAVGQVVQIIAACSRLLGLMPLAKKARVKCRQPQTVVLMKDDCRLRGCPEHTSGQEPSTLP